MSLLKRKTFKFFDLLKRKYHSIALHFCLFSVFAVVVIFPLHKVALDGVYFDLKYMAKMEAQKYFTDIVIKMQEATDLISDIPNINNPQMFIKNHKLISNIIIYKKNEILNYSKQKLMISKLNKNKNININTNKAETKIIEDIASGDLILSVSKYVNQQKIEVIYKIKDIFSHRLKKISDEDGLKLMFFNKRKLVLTSASASALPLSKDEKINHTFEKLLVESTKNIQYGYLLNNQFVFLTDSELPFENNLKLFFSIKNETFSFLMNPINEQFIKIVFFALLLNFLLACIVVMLKDENEKKNKELIIELKKSTLINELINASNSLLTLEEKIIYYDERIHHYDQCYRGFSILETEINSIDLSSVLGIDKSVEDLSFDIYYQQHKFGHLYVENGSMFDDVFYKKIGFIIGFEFHKEQEKHEQNKFNDELVNQSKLATLGVMAGGIAHEINNPLSLVQIVAQKSIKKYGDDPMFSKILIGVKRIRDIVESMRRLSRNKKQTALFNSIDLMKDVLEVTKSKVFNANVNINYNKEKSIQLNSDYVQISQVLINLISNSVDAMKSNLDTKNKEITIDIYLKNEICYITASDIGSGVPKSIQENIFELFFTTKKVGEGTGLGLGLSKKIMIGLDGDLTLDKDYQDGARFIISFPVGDLGVNDVSDLTKIAS